MFNTEPDDPQAWESAETLYQHDQDELIRAVGCRVSRYTLDFFTENLREAPPEYWQRLMREIIAQYSLNSLKLYLADTYRTVDLRQQCTELLYFLKIDLVQYLSDNGIRDYPSRDELLNMIRHSGLSLPHLFKWCLLYLDEDSYRGFIRRAVDESREDTYSDEI